MPLPLDSLAAREPVGPIRPNYVRARAATDVVDLPVAGDYDVVGAAAVEHVCPGSADDKTGIVFTPNSVGAVVTVEAVASGTSSQLVVAGCPTDRKGHVFVSETRT